MCGMGKEMAKSSVQSSQLTEDERAPPIGYFNFADSYWVSARELNKLNLKTTHPKSPVNFLYHQAIELYLKSCLRLHGRTVEQIKGHRIAKLMHQTKKYGISFDDEDMEIFELLDSANVVINARYLRVDCYSQPSVEGLDKTCSNIRDLVAIQMKANGLPVRSLYKHRVR